VKPANITVAAVDVANNGSPKTAGTPAAVQPPDKVPAKPKAKETIQVSHAVLDAAAERGRAGKAARLVSAALIILRNPLVILLAASLAISFATGDARAGT
jgi:hypothetical protein